MGKQTEANVVVGIIDSVLAIEGRTIEKLRTIYEKRELPDRPLA